LTAYLEENGFAVQKSYHLPTAFRAEYVPPQGAGNYTVSVMCEYDSLPGIGHACGHNLIAEAGVAAALGIKSALEADKSLKGRLVVLGTPAEEGGGGKIILLNAGAFKTVDCALMVHPSRADVPDADYLAINRVAITYEGKESHAAAAPWEGINALDAAVACYNSISQLRQQMKPTWRVHGIITDGGRKPNITPAKASLEYYIRAPNAKELAVLKEAVTRCFEAAALSSNCKIAYVWDDQSAYDDVNHNKPLVARYKKYSEELGVVYKYVADGGLRGSTDTGNVSYAVPTIHPLYAIPTNAMNHTKEFTACAGSDAAQPSTLVAGKTMALMALDLYADKKFRDEVKAAFDASLK